MEHSAVITYLKNWATNFIGIAYSASQSWAFCHNIDELRERERNIPLAKFTLVLDDMHTGRITGGTGNYQDMPTYGFMIMRKVKQTKYDDEETAYSEAKAMILKFVALMRRDQEEQISGSIAYHLVPESISYRRVGPQLDNLHGCGITFQLRDNINDLVQYDADDYLP